MFFSYSGLYAASGADTGEDFRHLRGRLRSHLFAALNPRGNIGTHVENRHMAQGKLHLPNG